MSKSPTLSDIVNILSSATILNANWDAIQAAFQNTLSRDGSTPNTMGADLDLNSNDILNVKTVDTDSLRLAGSLVTALSATLSWKGPWTTATEYTAYDFVSNAGSTYICLVSHTSNGAFAADLAADKWALVAQAGASGAGSGDLLAANNLSDVDNTATALSNIGGQPLDSTLTTLSGETITAAGLALLDDADAAAQRSTLGLGNSATTDLIDEDDMVSNLDTRAPTQQSVKAYVDNSILVYEDGEDATTTSTAHDFTNIPAGVNEIEIHYWGVSVNNTDDLLIQIGSGGTPLISGYTSQSSTYAATRLTTRGFVVILSGAGNTVTGKMVLSRIPGTNKWFSVHDGNVNTNVFSAGQGSVTLSGTLDMVRLRTIAASGTYPGTGTFDGGGWSIRCRK